MYSDPLSTTTPAAVGICVKWSCRIDNPDCVKWRETLPSQEESAERDIPMGQLVTRVLVSRESPLEIMSQNFSGWGDKRTIQQIPVDLYMVGQAISSEKAFVPGPGKIMISSH